MLDTHLPSSVFQFQLCKIHAKRISLCPVKQVLLVGGEGMELGLICSDFFLGVGWWCILYMCRVDGVGLL